MSKRVYFLGAGATKADYTDTPLLDDLLQKILFERVDDQYFEKEILGFLKKYFHSDINEASCPSIQDVLSFLDSCLFDDHCYDLDRVYLQKIKNYIVLLMAELLQRKLASTGKGVTEKFAKLLNNNDVIISTNYDILIDNSLVPAQQYYNYGVQCRKHVTFQFRNFILGRDVSVTPDTPNNHGGIKLLKLHGSLNWVYCSRCDELDVSFFEKGAVRCMQSPQRCCNDYCTGFYEPIIISPGHLKVYENRLIKEIWQLAEVAIAESDEIIFIGYSMPHDDYEIKSMLLRGIVKNVKRPKIIVVNLGDSGKASYKHLFGDVDYRGDGFESYVNEMTNSQNQSV